jgi:hypothetical protein
MHFVLKSVLRVGQIFNDTWNYRRSLISYSLWYFRLHEHTNSDFYYFGFLNALFWGIPISLLFGTEWIPSKEWNRFRLPLLHYAWSRFFRITIKHFYLNCFKSKIIAKRTNMLTETFKSANRQTAVHLLKIQI